MSFIHSFVHSFTDFVKANNSDTEIQKLKAQLDQEKLKKDQVSSHGHRIIVVVVVVIHSK